VHKGDDDDDDDDDGDENNNNNKLLPGQVLIPVPTKNTVGGKSPPSSRRPGITKDHDLR